MIWYAMACALMAALLCLAIGGSRLPTPAIAAIDLAALAWLGLVCWLVMEAAA